jgi:hypothetical protein
MDQKQCRVCHCSDDDPCIDDETGTRCHWVESNLCSFCAADPLMPPAEGDLLIEPGPDYK